jgi:hypothetical protein
MYGDGRRALVAPAARAAGRVVTAASDEETHSRVCMHAYESLAFSFTPRTGYRGGDAEETSRRARASPSTPDSEHHVHPFSLVDFL